MTNSDLGFDDEFMATMLGEFLDESQGYLNTLNDNLLALDELVKSCADDALPTVDLEMLNEMFRAAHSMKGLSAMLQFHDINALTHKIENVFDAARHEELSVRGEVVELMFQAIDRLSQMVDHLTDPDAPVVEYRGVVQDIQTLLECGSVKARPNDASPNDASADDAHRLQTEGDRTPSQDTECDYEEDFLADVHDEVNMEDKYISLFLSDAEETLDSLTEQLQAESAATELTPLLTVCHRIKGASATVGLNRPAKLAHAMEDLLQQLIAADARFTTEARETFADAVEAIRSYLHPLKEGQLPEETAVVSCNLNLAYARLLAFAPSPYNAMTDAEVHAETGQSTTAQPTETGTKLSPWDDACRRRILAEGVPEGRSTIGRIGLRAHLPLAEVKVEQLRGQLSAQGHLFFCEQQGSSEDGIVLLFGLNSDTDSETIRHLVSLDGISSVDLLEVFSEATATRPLSADSGSPPTDGASISQPAAASPPTVLPRETTANGAPSAAANSTVAPEDNSSDSTRQKNKPAETLRVDIDRLDHLMNLAGQLVINKARFGQIGDQLKSIASPRHSSHLLTGVEFTLEKLLENVENGRHAGHEHRNILESVRTCATQIREDVLTVRRDIEQLSQARTLVNDLSEAVHQLERVADGIQKSVMDTRMVPVGPLFARFRRVVRDISRMNGRHIQLVIRGENTELDKRMIDELADPLIHMVRNSADHGIEPPDERLAAGKPAQGTITLDAFHRGNRVFVQIKDDGRGLAPDKIRDKAISKGIISAADAERLTPQQVFQLIWEPGFSTAEKVTEVSGRGMGMDIVRSKIENINGTVELDSVPGEGTTITIKLPLTMAILPSLLTEIDDAIYSIPVESVIEIVHVPQADLTTIHGMPTARIRGRVVSVVELADLFHWNEPTRERLLLGNDDCTLVIIGADGSEMGLVVHDLLGEQDIVIKSLAENFRNVEGIAGASILGNGRVSLILDVVAMLSLQRTQASRIQSSRAPSRSNVAPIRTSEPTTSA